MDALRTLYVVCGMPAVGKTTFARKLAARTSACLIDIDTATEPLVQAAMRQINGNPDDRDSPTFKDTFREAIYQTLFEIAEANLPHSDAIVTGPFTKELNNPDWPSQIAAKLATPCHIKCLFLHCPAQLRKRRLEQRDNPRDRSKLENWEEHIKYYETATFPAYPHFPVNTGEADAFETALSKGLLG